MGMIYPEVMVDLILEFQHGMELVVVEQGLLELEEMELEQLQALDEALRVSTAVDDEDGI